MQLPDRSLAIIRDAIFDPRGVKISPSTDKSTATKNLLSATTRDALFVRREGVICPTHKKEVHLNIRDKRCHVCEKGFS